MNLFKALGYTFNLGQEAIIGIQPTTDYFVPRILISDTALTMSCNVGFTPTSSFTVKGTCLTGNVNLSISGTGFSVSPTTITASEAAAGKTVTVTYTPTAAGTHNCTITLSSPGADNKTVSLTGTAKLVRVLGDVNGDGEVTIADVNALLDIIQNGNSSSPNYGRADVNGDGEVNMDDVNAVIDIIQHNLPGIPGDVNGDGKVTISDVNALIDIILTGNTSSPNYGRADVNGDGEVNIADISEVIDIIMNN